MRKIATTEEFVDFTKKFWENNEKPFAFGLGEPIYSIEGELIAVKWITVNVKENLGTAAVLMDAGDELSGATIAEMYFEPFMGDGKFHANISALQFIGDEYPVVRYYMSEDELTKQDPIDHIDVHFRHALMSRRYYQPNKLNLNGAFGKMPNLIYTNAYAYTVEEYQQRWFEIQAEGEFPICHDRFPPMYWANPALDGVRVANTMMVRNGAHLGKGTTVMHYGFVNMNAGTEGEAMVESRIAAGVFMGDGTDLGAGAGFLGTLSGGNDRVLSAGKKNLVGAMSEVGIILGLGNQVAAGVTILANTKVLDMRDNEWKKGVDFDNCNNTLFLFNTQEGRMEARDVKNPVELNEELHAN